MMFFGRSISFFELVVENLIYFINDLYIFFFRENFCSKIFDYEHYVIIKISSILTENTTQRYLC